jgi:flavin-binding protein dodecin
VSVARVTEISSTSSRSFEDAVRQGLERATKTLRGVTAAWIKEQRVRLRDGKVEEYQPGFPRWIGVRPASCTSFR